MAIKERFMIMEIPQFGDTIKPVADGFSGRNKAIFLTEKDAEDDIKKRMSGGMMCTTTMYVQKVFTDATDPKKN